MSVKTEIVAESKYKCVNKYMIIHNVRHQAVSCDHNNHVMLDQNFLDHTVTLWYINHS